MAALVAAPELMPTSRPSSVARRRAMATASSLDTCGRGGGGRRVESGGLGGGGGRGVDARRRRVGLLLLA